MADYDGQWIAQLNPADPQGTEKKSLGDNAIREIKLALKNAFPNSPIGDQYQGTLSQLSDLVANTSLPRDLIVAWKPSGAIGEGPVGWTVCDGRPRKTGGGNAPNLTNRFIAGWGLAQPGQEGGNAEIVIKNANGTLKTFTTSSTALSRSQLPDLSNSIYINVSNSTSSDNHVGTSYVAGGSNSSFTRRENPIETDGLNGQGHSHTFTIDTTGSNTGPNVPPYYAVVFLIKD